MTSEVIARRGFAAVHSRSQGRSRPRDRLELEPGVGSLLAKLAQSVEKTSPADPARLRCCRPRGSKPARSGLPSAERVARIMSFRQPFRSDRVIGLKEKAPREGALQGSRPVGAEMSRGSSFNAPWASLVPSACQKSLQTMPSLFPVTLRRGAQRALHVRA